MDILAKVRNAQRRNPSKGSGELLVHFVKKTVCFHEWPIRQRFSCLPPCCRNTLYSTVKRDNTPDHGTGCIDIPEAAGGQPKRLLVVVETRSSTPEHKGNGILRG